MGIKLPLHWKIEKDPKNSLHKQVDLLKDNNFPSISVGVCAIIRLHIEESTCHFSPSTVERPAKMETNDGSSDFHDTLYLRVL